MSLLNSIGLDQKKSQHLARELNILLSSYSVFYQNVRAYHWNIQGNDFFELHIKFEELYNDLIVKIDDIAERILTLDETPDHRYSEDQKNSLIKEATEVKNGKIGAKDILSSLQIFIVKERKILELAGELQDEGTSALMSDYIREQEKLIWMYSSYLA